MENELTAGGSGLDAFLSKITTDILNAVLKKVSHEIMDMNDEEAILEQLTDESFQDSVMDTTGVHTPDLLEIWSGLEEASIREKCSKLVEHTFIEVHEDLKRVFDSNDQEMLSDIESSRKKLWVLDYMRDSNRLHTYFQELSFNVIQNAFDKIKVVEGSKNVEKEISAAPVMESDIAVSIEQGSASRIEQAFNIDNSDIALDFSDNVVDRKTSLLEENLTADMNDKSENKESNVELRKVESSNMQNESTLSDLRFTTADSEMYQTTEEGAVYMYDNEQCSDRDSFFSAQNGTILSQGNSEERKEDSTLFTTADDFREHLRDSALSSFDKELPKDATILQSTPNRTTDTSVLNFDTTLTETSVPHRSTPLANDDVHNQETSLPSAEASNILPEGLQNADGFEQTLPGLWGDDSSLGEPSSPRTWSRQSSTIGNVTLEFDTDWEASMKGMNNDSGTKFQPDEKHRVILHELSFEDNHRLKAPELLCPVFLAVEQDDDDDDDELGDEERKKRKRKHRMSQSIDDLCEMISDDDDDDQDPRSRRRAMSLEGKKPTQKELRKKAPTRDELMAAFEELQNEILEDEKTQGEVEERKPNEEDKIEEGRKETGEEGAEERTGLDDPLRWHTVVFNGQHKVIDLELLEPFLKVLTHGGYHHEGEKKTVIVVLTACNLPKKTLKSFIISTMDLLVTSEEYIFVYFHGGTSKNQSPSFSWLKKYYQYIDHRLRKSVTKVYVVHPNLWLKSVFRLCRPFLSSNFARKLKFVNSLKELSCYIKTDYIYIPDEVVRVDPDYRKVHSS